MKFLSLDLIKQQLRIDTDCDDGLLELYGDSAEMTLAQYLNRGKNVDDMIASLTEEYGEIPAPIYQAALLLTDSGYQHRSPASPTQMYYVLYDFDLMVKPFMRL